MKKNKFYGIFNEEDELVHAFKTNSEENDKEIIKKIIESLDVNRYIREITSLEYRNYDKSYDNQCKFLEYIISEKSSIDKQTIITEDILFKSGFKRTDTEEECKYYQDKMFIEDYSSWRRYTDDIDNDNDYIKLDISKGITNMGIWNLHIDNNLCQSIGSADITTIWQFNMLMEIFDSKFRL